MLEVSTGWSQTVGKRDYQQDGVTRTIWPNGFALILLSDGMGGAVHGDTASREILKSFNTTFCDSTEDDMPTRLNDALIECNAYLNEIITTNEEYRGMGGTLIATAFNGDELFYLSVGDSPLWLVRDSELIRLNEDHSKKADFMKQVELGEMTIEEVENHPKRNQLTSAVMGMQVDRIDNNVTSLQAGDIILLASDGIETLTDEKIAETCSRFSSADSQTIAEHFISLVEAEDTVYQDNATILVMKYKNQDQSTENENGEE